MTTLEGAKTMMARHGEWPLSRHWPNGSNDRNGVDFARLLRAFRFLDPGWPGGGGTPQVCFVAAGTRRKLNQHNAPCADA